MDCGNERSARSVDARPEKSSGRESSTSMDVTTRDKQITNTPNMSQFSNYGFNQLMDPLGADEIFSRRSGGRLNNNSTSLAPFTTPTDYLKTPSSVMMNNMAQMMNNMSQGMGMNLDALMPQAQLERDIRPISAILKADIRECPGEYIPCLSSPVYLFLSNSISRLHALTFFILFPSSSLLFLNQPPSINRELLCRY